MNINKQTHHGVINDTVIRRFISDSELQREKTSPGWEGLHTNTRTPIYYLCYEFQITLSSLMTIINGDNKASITLLYSQSALSVCMCLCNSVFVGTYPLLDLDIFIIKEDFSYHLTWLYVGIFYKWFGSFQYTTSAVTQAAMWSLWVKSTVKVNPSKMLVFPLTGSDCYFKCLTIFTITIPTERPIC